MLVQVNMLTCVPLAYIRVPRQNGGRRKSTPVSAVPSRFTSSRLIQIRFRCDTYNLSYFTWLFPECPVEFSHCPVSFPAPLFFTQLAALHLYTEQTCTQQNPGSPGMLAVSSELMCPRKEDDTTQEWETQEASTVMEVIGTKPTEVIARDVDNLFSRALCKLQQLGVTAVGLPQSLAQVSFPPGLLLSCHILQMSWHLEIP